MNESLYHDLPPGYYSSSGDAAPQLPYYTKAQQNSDEIEPGETDSDSHLRESLTQFNSSMNGINSVEFEYVYRVLIDGLDANFGSLSGLVEQDVGETVGQDQDTVMDEYATDVQNAQQTSVSVEHHR
jgi:hypothetical protein